MPVSQRGKAWQAQVNHKGRRYRRDLPTEAEARAWEQETKVRLAAGLLPKGIQTTQDGKPTTLAQLYDQTHARFWRGARGERSLAHNGREVRDIIGPTTPIIAINEAAIARLVIALQNKGNSNGTINRKLSALSKMLHYAQRLACIDRVPPIDKAKEAERRFLWWDDILEQDVLGMFRELGLTDMADFCTVAVDTGCRVGELLRIERDRIVRSGDRPLLMVWESKSGKARSIPLTSRAASALNRRALQGRLAFPDLTQARISRSWGRMLAGLAPATAERIGTPHTMRHTFCSRLVQRGVDLATVKDLAGHSSITVTMRYAHLSQRSKYTAIETLEVRQAT